MNLKKITAAMVAVFGLAVSGCGDETKVYVDPPEPGVTVIVYVTPDAGSARGIDGDGSIDTPLPEADAGIQPDAALWDAAAPEPDQGNGNTGDAGNFVSNDAEDNNPNPDAEAEEPSDNPDSGLIHAGGDPCVYIDSPDSDGDGITDACEEATAEPECHVDEDCVVPDDTCLNRTTRRQYFGVTGQCVEGVCQYQYQDFDCGGIELPIPQCQWDVNRFPIPGSGYCDDHLEAWGAVCNWDYALQHCEDGCNAQGTSCSFPMMDTDGDRVPDELDCAPNNEFAERIENGQCVGDWRVIEMLWTPGTASRYARNPETNEYEEQPIDFTIPAEVTDLFGWITCWSHTADYEADNFITEWMVSTSAPANSLPTMSLLIFLPFNDDTLACEWEVYGICEGQGMPSGNTPITINNDPDAGFCWQSVQTRMDVFSRTAWGNHQYRWRSPASDDIHNTEFGSYNGPQFHGFVPVLPDMDYDRRLDNEDNCLQDWNPDQWDSDLDGIGDACDNNN